MRLCAVHRSKLPAVVHTVKTGYGAGKRDTGLAGYLKVTLAEMEQEAYE